MNGDSGTERRAASSRLSVPTGVGVEIVEGNFGGAIVGGLGGGVDDHGGAHNFDEIEDALAIAYVQRVMLVAGNLFAKPLE